MKLTLNGETKEFSDIRTVRDLLTALGYEGKRLAVELNGKIVPKSQHDTTELNDGDALELVVAVGGG